MIAFKKKHLILVASSSLIIVAVILFTFAGYSLYTQWKDDTLSANYRDTVYELTAKLFKENVKISGLSIHNPDSGMQPQIPVLKGTVENKTSKTITSAALELSFSRPDGYVLYRDWFYPLGEELFSGSPFFSGIKRTSDVLKSGETMSFEHLLHNSPAEVVSQFLVEAESSKDGSGNKIKLEVDISGMSVS